MSADIELLINENLHLKKAYQLSKVHQQKLEEQLRQARQNLKIADQNQTKNNKKIQELYQKNRRMQGDFGNSNTTFISQIQELKSLVQQKQRELQIFQLKMIPTLDQDMLRVKLIAQMQGPYQQTVDKKNHEIMKLKDQIHQLRREKQILQFSLENKQKQFKKQLQENKLYYQSEIERLNKQLSHFSYKRNGKNLDKQMMQSYRSQIDQLRISNQMHKNTEQELRREVLDLKIQRQKMLAQFAKNEAIKAVQLRGNQYENEWKQLKNVKLKLEDEIQQCRQELQRLKQKNKNLQITIKKNQSKYQSNLKDQKQQFEKIITRLKQETNQYQDQLRKLKVQRNKYEHDYIEISQKLKKTTIENNTLQAQINSFKLKIDYNDTVISQQANQLKEKRKNQQLQYKKPSLTIPLPSPQKQRPNYDLDKTQAQTAKVRVLESKVQKLTKKLQFANKKIIQLISQKAKLTNKQTEHCQKARSHSLSMDYDTQRLLLEYRDSSFVPMCPPVLIEPLHHVRF